MSNDDKIIEHESYGFIRASRVQGHTDLFDSEIRHQHFVSVTIGQAKQDRHLHRTWNYGSKELITVDMSEHQFAQFITSMNLGSGASCTIRRFDGKQRQLPPPDLNARTEFDKEIRAEVAEVAEILDRGVEKLSALAEKGKAGKTELRDALSSITAVQQQLVSSLPFVLRQFTEYMEEATQRAKSELAAHALMLGLQGAALSEGTDIKQTELLP